MASTKVRLVSFEFNVSQAYILEFGETYIRFYKDEAIINDPITGNPYEKVTPYAEADLFGLDVNTQSADTLFIFHPTYPPAKLVRNDHDDWTYTPFTCGGIFNAAGDYPCCGTLHEQRFWYAGTNNSPVSLWGSETGNYEVLTNDPEDPSSGILFTLVSGSIDKIRWLYSSDHLLAGTGGGVWKVWPTATGEALSQENINAKKQIALGVSDVFPIMVEDAVLFVTRMKTTIRRLAYSFEADKIIAPSLMRVASHIAEGASAVLSGVVQLAFQKEPFPILWAVRSDGQLLGMVYDIQERIYAWFRVVMDGIVESVACISKDGEEDQVWIVVKRTIQAVDKRYIEYFMPHNFYSTIANAFFVHSGLSATGVNNTITLAHLKGETVYALVDGIVQGPFVADAGTGVVTLTTPSVSKVIAGLPYTSKVEPMKLHTPTEQGTARGKRQKINKVTTCLYETGQGVQIGPDTSNLRNLFVNEANPASGYLFTGDMDFDFEGDWEGEATIVVQQASPLPMTILGLIPRVTVHDEN